MGTSAGDGEREEDPEEPAGYGARSSRLLIYRDVVDRCAKRVPALEVSYFVEDEGAGPLPVFPVRAGRVSVAGVWPRLPRPFEAAYYISGPPPMLRAIREDLRSRNVAAEAIHIDAWE